MRKLPAYGLALSIGLLVFGPVAQARARVKPPQRQPAPLSLKIQTPIPVGPPPTIDGSDAPDPVQFFFFFRHLANLDAAADGAVAAGNPAASQWKSLEQRAAGLTDTEGAILKQVAFGCNQSVSDHDAGVQEGDEISLGQPAGSLEIVNSAIADLQMQLGDEVFQALAQYVRDNFGSDLGVEIIPLPVGAVQSGIGDPGPPVSAQSGPPEISMLSHVSKLSGFEVFAECQTTLEDDVTRQSYLSGVTGCALQGFYGGYGIDPVNVPCSTPDTCVGIVPSGPGLTRWATGAHGVRLYPSLCGTGGTPGLSDPLHYCSVAGTPIPVFLNSGSIFPQGDGPVCWPYATAPNDNCLLAQTSSGTVTFVDLSPFDVTLSAKGQQRFTPNIPAVLHLSGPGTLVSGLYTAPATLSGPQQAVITACDANPLYFDDCTAATIHLVPLKVELVPDSAEVLPDGHQAFSATVTPNTPVLPVTWTVTDPTHSAVVTPNTTDSSRAVFTAPPSSKISAEQELTVKACVNANLPAEVCATAKVLVPKIQLSVTAPKQRLITGETVQLTALVIGSSLPRPVEWTATPEIVDAKLTVLTPDTLVATYKASPFEKNPIFIQACLKDAGEICSDPYRLEIVDPITITAVTGDWDAGELAAPFTITGTGFGAHPTVSFTGLQSTVLAATDTLISGVAVIPVGKGGGSTRVTVTASYSNGDSASLAWPPQGAIQIVPVSLLAISPASAEIRLGTSKPFSALCLTAKTTACSSPETVSWGASPGTIAPTTGMNVTYTAPASGTSTQATISACWSGGTLCAPSAHVTLLPADGVTVTVSPKTATVLTGHMQSFGVQVAGSTNTGVTWSLLPQTPEAGSITQGGVYSAPATLGSVTTVTVIATSQADTTKKDTATVTLTAPPPLTLTGTPSPASSPYGTTLTWTATASGGDPATIQYAFFRRLAGAAAWVPDVHSPAWQTSNVYHWTPTAADVGSWDIYIWVRDANTPANANTYGFAAGFNSLAVQITAPFSPLTLTATPSPASSPYGTTLTWTATASGGDPATIQYAFFRRLAGAAAWIPDVNSPVWQTSNVYHWTPTAADVGSWDVYIWVRDANTPANANTYGFAAGFNSLAVQITGVSQLYPATGWVDGYNNQHIWGWACDPDYPLLTSRVDIGIPNGPGLGSSGAFLPSNAGVTGVCLGGTAHNFDFYPSGGIPSGTHFNVWSIDLPYATAGNDNRKVSGTGAIGDGTEFVIP